jgi:hypothetical protein
MSRVGLVAVCLLFTGAAQAQLGAGQPGAGPPLPAGQGTDPDARSKRDDPRAVEIPLYTGARVCDVLQALNDKGFHIKWEPEQVPPTMKLLERPKSSRIDKMLTEILAPHELRADHNLMDGGWRVRPKNKKKHEVEVSDASPPAPAP